MNNYTREIEKITAETAMNLLLSKEVKCSDVPENIEISIHNCVELCVWLDMKPELQKAFNQEITIVDLCYEIAKKLAVEIHSDRCAGGESNG